MAGKPELVAKIASSSGLTKAQAATALDSVIGAITGTLASGESVTLSGFGTFRVSPTAERRGRNPATGAAITIPASKRIGFSAGSKLNAAVKGS
jgi:DNA-binding protein HU-beta